MKNGVLLLENDPQQREIWKVCLQNAGYNVTALPFIQTKLVVRNGQPPALIVLGIPLLKRDAETVGRWIAEWRHIPILVLGPADQPEMVVQLLDAGADDFVMRSCRRDELLARVRAALRRRQNPARIMRIDGFVLDFDARRAFIDNRDLHLTKTEFSLLAELAHRAGQICSHNELLGKVWGGEYWDANHYLHVYLGRIRKKLGRRYSSLLETVARIGYVLHASPRRLQTVISS